MRIILTGGTGFIGRALLRRFVADNHSVVLLTRNATGAQRLGSKSVRIVEWDGKGSGDLTALVDGADAVINLAGEPIAAKRWTPRQKKKILASRLDATKAIVAAIAKAERKPSVLVNGSAVGYYGAVEEGEITESRSQGTGFLADTCSQWESEARSAETYGIRVVLLRTGIVLGEDGGALAKMLLPFKLFVGGPIGTGRQWFPWIHRDDVVSIILFTIDHRELSGPVNLAAPESVTMKQFCSALGTAMHRPSWAPVPAFVLKFALGEMSDMLLTGQNVVPSKLQHLGYAFHFPKLARALGTIV